MLCTDSHTIAIRIAKRGSMSHCSPQMDSTSGNQRGDRSNVVERPGSCEVAHNTKRDTGGARHFRCGIRRFAVPLDGYVRAAECGHGRGHAAPEHKPAAPREAGRVEGRKRLRGRKVRGAQVRNLPKGDSTWFS